MRRLWLLPVVLSSLLGWAQSDAGAQVDVVKQLMREGLERELPSPSTARPQWPRAEAPRAQPPALRPEPGSKRVESMAERVRQDATARARAVAEERRTTPDNTPGTSQSRTRAAKAATPAPPRPVPPRP
ncbi:MAG: hypothetical protein Q8L48_19950 [Archangium sp.]|nr:hypothetical protein [Archangium sp.]